jgi:hypothetical protein
MCSTASSTLNRRPMDEVSDAFRPRLFDRIAASQRFSLFEQSGDAWRV